MSFKPHNKQRPPFKKGGTGGGGGGGGRSRAPESTQQEVHYLKQLIEHKTPVCVKLRNNEEVRGVIEYYDLSFIRLTRTNAPNLFIFKHEIKYLYETGPKPKPAATPPEAQEEPAEAEA